MKGESRLCQNGIDFDECKNQSSLMYQPYCEDCGMAQAEQAQEDLMSDYYGGSQAVTLNEQINEARKLK